MRDLVTYERLTRQPLVIGGDSYLVTKRRPIYPCRPLPRPSKSAIVWKAAWCADHQDPYDPKVGLAVIRL